MKEKFVDRLLKFVEEQGGIYEVAEQLDMSPQTFYTMRRRNSLPNLALVYALKEQYPVLNIDWLILGEKKVIDPEVVELREKLRRSEAIVDTLTGVSKKDRGAIFRPEETKAMLEKRSRIDSCRMMLSNLRRPAKKVVSSGRVPQVAVQLLVAKYGTGIQQN